MTKLDKILLTNLDRYVVDEKTLPITMQKYSFLTQIAARAIEKNISLIMVEEPEDYIYFLLGEIGMASLVDTGRGKLVDPKLFFQILESYLVGYLDVGEIYTKYFNVYRHSLRNKKLKQEAFLEMVCNKLHLTKSIWYLSRINFYDVKMPIRSSIKITNLLDNFINNREYL
jgi:hypothetical protein